MTAVIIINWNGFALTRLCLDSLERAEGDFFVVVVDNGSTDSSVQDLSDVCAEYKAHNVYLLSLNDNYGFAGGNNRGISYAMQFHPDSYMLLNNDTEVEPDFFIRLTNFSKAHPEYRVLSPRINYWIDKNKIWYAGGRLTFGSRQNIYRDKNENVVKGMQWLRVTFVSGCALFCYKDIVPEDGCLLSERFFFSEEDYEFSLSMRDRHIPMACITDSVIYHKVGMARNGGRLSCSLGKDYNYYLGRLICARLHYNKLEFKLILELSMIKALGVINRNTSSLCDTLKVISHLAEDAKRKEGISHQDFLSLSVTGTYFDFLK